MLYSMLDVKSRSYGRLFEARNDSEALRIVVSSIVTGKNRGDDNIIALYPEDFCLYEIGDFDSVSGVLIQDEAHPVRLASGPELLLEVTKFDDKQRGVN